MAQHDWLSDLSRQLDTLSTEPELEPEPEQKAQPQVTRKQREPVAAAAALDVHLQESQLEVTRTVSDLARKNVGQGAQPPPPPATGGLERARLAYEAAVLLKERERLASERQLLERERLKLQLIYAQRKTSANSTTRSRPSSAERLPPGPRTLRKRQSARKGAGNGAGKRRDGASVHLKRIDIGQGWELVVRPAIDGRHAGDCLTLLGLAGCC